MSTILARHYATGRPIQVTLAGGTISGVSSLAEDADLPFVAPGFVDLQINGYQGQEFNDLKLTVGKVEQISLAMDQDGVTKYLPTLTTQSQEMFEHVVAVIARSMNENDSVAKRVAGIHVEGPYISTEDGPRGAHPLSHCRAPSWDEFARLIDASDGKIRILTLSPEYDGSVEFIKRVVDAGVVVAIGHTAASPDQIKAAVDAGATMSTHLGNGAHGTIRRHPNYIWEQLAEDRLTASLIADGHHLPDSVLKSFVRGKQLERSVLVSDITGMGGMPPGVYESESLGGGVEVMEDGRLCIAGQRQLLAGAALPMFHGIPIIMRAAGLGLTDAIEMATNGPARIIGLPENHINPGDPADLVVFEMANGTFSVLQTINAGEVVYSAASQ